MTARRSWDEVKEGRADSPERRRGYEKAGRAVRLAIEISALREASARPLRLEVQEGAPHRERDREELAATTRADLEQTAAGRPVLQERLDKGSTGSSVESETSWTARSSPARRNADASAG